jgi:hypothetical protein
VTENRIRCTVTRYSVVDDRLVETTTEETTGYHVQPLDGYLYLRNSAASARVSDLLAQAQRGQLERPGRHGGWSAQAGTPPVKVECQAERWGRYALLPRRLRGGLGRPQLPEDLRERRGAAGGASASLGSATNTTH